MLRRPMHLRPFPSSKNVEGGLPLLRHGSELEGALSSTILLHLWRIIDQSCADLEAKERVLS